MNKFTRRIISLILVLSMVFLVACGKPKDQDTTSTTSGDQETETGFKEIKGKYIEEEIQLPKGVNLVSNIKKLEDGTLRFVSNDGIYDSKDDGVTWEKTDIGSEIISEQNMIGSGAVNKSGDIVLEIYKTTDDEMASNTEYYYVEASGTATKLTITLPELDLGNLDNGGTMPEDGEDSQVPEGESNVMNPEGSDDIASSGEKNGVTIPDDGSAITNSESGEGGLVVGGNAVENMENQLREIILSDQGELIGLDFMGDIYQLNAKTGDIIETYSESEYINVITVVQNKLFYLDLKQDLHIIDLESKKEEEGYPVLNNFLKERSSGQGQYRSSGLILGAGADNNLLICDSSGLYNYTLGGNMIEQLIKGSNNSIGNMDNYILGMVQVSETTIFISMMDSKNGASKLLKYTYSDETTASPTSELSIYSLYDNQVLRQFINQYQQEHSDTMVNLEIGVEEGGSVADAIRTLNANIMAGKGPDLLILDGMSVENYVQKNLLEDITPIVTEVEESDGIFENIKNAAKVNDKIYAMPLRVKVPYMVGDVADLDSIDGTETLATKFEELSSVEHAIPTSFFLPSVLIDQFYSISGGLMNESGTLDQEQVKTFLASIKKAYDATVANAGQETIDSMKGMIEEVGLDAYGESIPGMAMIGEGSKFDLGNLADMSSYNVMLAAIREADKKAAAGTTSQNKVQNITKGDKSYYVPTLTAGISSKSNNLEASKEFMKALLSETLQSTGSNGSSVGFPVNKKAFDKAIAKPSENQSSIVSMVDAETGAQSMVTIDWASEEEIEKFKETINSLNTPLIKDQMVMNALQTEGTKVLEGTATVDEATANIMQSMQLYLSE